MKEISRDEFQDRVVALLDDKFPPQFPNAYTISGLIYDEILCRPENSEGE